MILDNNTILSGSYAGNVATGQAVTGTGNVVSTNVLDLLVARDIGKGEPLDIEVDVTVAAAGGTSVQIQVVQADDAAITTNVNVLSQTDAILTATLVAGRRVPIRVPRVDPNVARRYLALRYVLVGTYTAGSYFAAVLNKTADNPIYPAVGTVVL